MDCDVCTVVAGMHKHTSTVSRLSTVVSCQSTEYCSIMSVVCQSSSGPASAGVAGVWATREVAVQGFGGPTLVSGAWTDGLRQSRPDTQNSAALQQPLRACLRKLQAVQRSTVATAPLLPSCCFSRAAIHLSSLPKLPSPSAFSQYFKTLACVPRRRHNNTLVVALTHSPSTLRRPALALLLREGATNDGPKS